VQVADQGRGMSSVEQARLREMLQTSEVDKADDDGSALFICKKIVDISGGEIEI